MKFELLHRDGLARVGRLEIDGVSFETPAIAFVDTPGRGAPSKSLTIRTEDRASKGDIKMAPSGFSEEGEARAADAMVRLGYRGSPYACTEPANEFVVLPDTSAMLLDSKKFVDSVAKAKEGAGLLQPTFCSVMGLPHRLALLAYFGFDVFDSII